MDEDARDYNSPGFVFASGVPDAVGETLPAKVGAMAPDFEAYSLDGQVLRLTELRRKGHVVLLTGAVTSPMCAFEIPAMNQLQDEFATEGVSFYLLYSRESHPAENYPAHSSWEQKVSHARDLQQLEDVRIPVVVDSLDGTIHRSYGAWPAALFVIHRDGRLIYRSNMANAGELRQLLEDLVSAERLAAAGDMVHQQYSERLIPHLADKETHHRVYRRAGPKAFEDYWQQLPDLRNKWP